MSTFRKHFRVVWNDGDPVDVVTNAQDMADAAEVSDNKAMLSFALVHAALRRNGVNVPPFQEFVATLDEIQAQTNGSGSEELDPTEQMASTAEPSPYPS